MLSSSSILFLSLARFLNACSALIINDYLASAAGSSWEPSLFRRLFLLVCSSSLYLMRSISCLIVSYKFVLDAKSFRVSKR